MAMRNGVRIFIAALLFLMVGSISGPTLKACADNVEIDINYYDANGCWQGEHYVNCGCTIVSNSGVLTGAHWRHTYSVSCYDYSVLDAWYENINGQWTSVPDPGLSGC